jgi:NitT/TauT family transport system ATP-binding protein
MTWSPVAEPAADTLPARVAPAGERAAAAKGEAIALVDVSVQFGDFLAVEDGSLEVAPGEFVCLLGPSGCGKSTLLNVVAGFVGPARGQVLVGGRQVTGPDVSRGMVFQSSEALFPWLSVRQNVAFGPRMRGLSGARRGELCDHFLELVGLADAAAKLPGELSGGMRQRVQIARVLANQPSVVLMDEPFGALDAQTREVMQRELERIWTETRPTIVFVTHDITEALLLGDRVLTMTAGPAARIKSVYLVELERPRDETDRSSIELHRKLRHDIGEEVSKTLRAQGLDTGS